LNIGTLRAGTWPSSVPESLVLEGRYGIAVGENPTKARQEFRKVVAAAARRDPWLRKHPPRVEWWGGQFESASVPVDHPLPQTVAAALRDVRRKPAAFEGMPYGSDMRLLVKVAETPTILFGPGDVRRSHRPDEWVSLADLKACVQTLALAAVRFCRGRA
jgi:acetylornithine deacetylase